MRELCDLSSVQACRAIHVGSKAARLAELARAGLSVPQGFCVPVVWYREWLAAVGAPDAVDIDAWRRRAAVTPLPPGLREALLAQCARPADGDSANRWAVRSSALGEDGHDASFAGQGDSFLDLAAEEVPERVRACWLSLWSPRALAYRARQGGEAAMAVLIQRLVVPRVAGIAFSREPLTAEPVVVIEAVAGSGAALAQGTATPARYHVARDGHRQIAGSASPLAPSEVQAVAQLARQVESLLGFPADVEWALADGTLYVLQARPLNGCGDDVFDTSGHDDDLWTAAFIDERFPAPVSPLGWSLIQGPFERLALREPMAFLGHPEAWRRPVTKLHRGHPYIAVAAVASLYKLLPDALLPEDAARYFPAGRTELRRLATYPRSWREPRLWRAIASTLVRERANWSPWHNHRRWARCREAYTLALDGVAASLDGSPDAAALLALAERVQAANRDLLAVHRWSLTHAEVWYSLLRRLARAWLGHGWQETAARLVRGADTVSTAIDAELHDLAAAVAADVRLRAALAEAADVDDLVDRLPATESARVWLGQLADFLRRNGHRSYSLDVYQPNFAAAPRQVFELLLTLAEGRPTLSADDVGNGDGAAEPGRGVHGEAAAGGDRRQEAEVPGGERGRQLPGSMAAECLSALRWWQRLPFGALLALARRYLQLREEQRYFWQRGLALLRQIYLLLGEQLAAGGWLHSPADIFFLTGDEVARAAAGGPQPQLMAVLAARRRNEFAALKAEHAQNRQLAYPAFLRGRAPLTPPAPQHGEVLRGTPVSSGLAMGVVRVLRDPGELVAVKAGEVLVAPSVDPGWTPIFGKLAALVTECGGQLSHPAVVAREYGLPAVLAVPAATSRLRTGDRVLVDGAAGTVTLLAAVAELRPAARGLGVS